MGGQGAQVRPALGASARGSTAESAHLGTLWSPELGSALAWIQVPSSPLFYSAPCMRGSSLSASQGQVCLEGEGRRWGRGTERTDGPGQLCHQAGTPGAGCVQGRWWRGREGPRLSLGAAGRTREARNNSLASRRHVGLRPQGQEQQDAQGAPRGFAEVRLGGRGPGGWGQGREGNPRFLQASGT